MQLGNEQAIPILLELVIHYPANPFDKVCNWPMSRCTESSIHVTNADLENFEFFFGRRVRAGRALLVRSAQNLFQQATNNKPGEPKSILRTRRWHVCNSHISLWTHFGLLDPVWQKFLVGSCFSLVSPLLLYYLQIPSSLDICPVDPRHSVQAF
jgi:hypothetical protein